MRFLGKSKIFQNNKMRNSKKNFKRGRKAMTLTELLLASMIMAIVLCALLAQFIACSFLNESSRNLTRAVTHAQYVMEEIKDAAFDSIRDSGDSLWDYDAIAIGNEGLSVLKNESIDTEVSGTTLLTVTVTVTWENRSGRSSNLSLETLITEP